MYNDKEKKNTKIRYNIFLLQFIFWNSKTVIFLMKTRLDDLATLSHLY